MIHIMISLKTLELVQFKSFEMNWPQLVGGKVFMLDAWEVRSYVVIPPLSPLEAHNVLMVRLRFKICTLN